MRIAECLYQGNWLGGGGGGCRVHVYKESHLEGANMFQSGNQWLKRADECLDECTQCASGERALTPEAEQRNMARPTDS